MFGGVKSRSSEAFAALLFDGRVVTWGSREHGGEIPAEVSNQLRDVQDGMLLLSGDALSFIYVLGVLWWLMFQMF